MRSHAFRNFPIACLVASLAAPALLVPLACMGNGTTDGASDGDGGTDGDGATEARQATPAGTLRFGTAQESIAAAALRSDLAVVAMTNVPAPPEGSAYHAWISGTAGVPLHLGTARFQDGYLDLQFAASVDLLGTYDRASVTLETAEEPAAPSADVEFSALLPPVATAHLRALLSRAPDGSGVPQDKAYAAGFAAQVALSFGLARSAEAVSSLPGLRSLGEQIVNTLEGIDGPDWGDLDGNGNSEDPGDSYGVLSAEADTTGYAVETVATLIAAATAADATTDMVRRGTEAAVCAKTATDATKTARDSALAAARATEAGPAESALRAAAASLATALYGADGSAAAPNLVPEAGQGGIVCAYLIAQRMTTVPLAAPSTR
jgi:trimeric autotransporter adhesin